MHAGPQADHARRSVAKKDLDAEARHDLEGREAVSSPLAEPCKKRDDLGRPRSTHEGSGAGFRPGEELQHGACDNAERAFRTDEEMLQVIASIVLPQPGKAVPDRAIGQHHLEPEHEITRVAITQNRRAAGIGRDVPANGAGAFRAERERIEKTRRTRSQLHIGQHSTRFHSDRGIDRINRRDALHAAQGNHHAAIRHATADKPRIPALRHEGNARFATGLHDGRDLLGIRGLHGGDGRAMHEPARLLQKGASTSGAACTCASPVMERSSERRSAAGMVNHPVLIWARRAATS